MEELKDSTKTCPLLLCLLLELAPPLYTRSVVQIVHVLLVRGQESVISQEQIHLRKDQESCHMRIPATELDSMPRPLAPRSNTWALVFVLTVPGCLRGHVQQTTILHKTPDPKLGPDSLFSFLSLCLNLHSRYTFNKPCWLVCDFYPAGSQGPS